VGVVLGAVNGFLESRSSAINPLIVTLATLISTAALGGHLTGFSTVYLPPRFDYVRTATLASFPSPIILAAVFGCIVESCSGELSS